MEKKTIPGCSNRVLDIDVSNLSFTEFQINVTDRQRYLGAKGLAYAVANRGGCHLSATSFADEVFIPLLKSHSTRAKPRFIYFLEGLFAALNSLQVCIFTTYAQALEAFVPKYLPMPILKFAMRYFTVPALTFIDISVYSRF